jgi:hypothetical protein
MHLATFRSLLLAAQSALLFFREDQPRRLDPPALSTARLGHRDSLSDAFTHTLHGRDTEIQLPHVKQTYCQAYCSVHTIYCSDAFILVGAYRPPGSKTSL